MKFIQCFSLALICITGTKASWELEPDPLAHGMPEFKYSGPLSPKFWPSLFQSCAGEHQSPILISRLSSVQSNYGPFSFKGFDVLPLAANVTNNGHTAMVTLTLPGGRATISGGDLPGEFQFLNLHFHWGSDDARGSEHILDGVQYPIELHIVLQNTNYLSATEAKHHKDGIAVMSVLFKVGSVDNPALETIIQALGSIKSSATSKSFKPGFRLADLLPSDTSDFYRYFGSLTTPNCYESVTWTVFDAPGPISERQLLAFRRILDSENKDRKNNFRPVQPVNARIIHHNGGAHKPTHKHVEVKVVKIPFKSLANHGRIPNNHRKRYG